MFQSPIFKKHYMNSILYTKEQIYLYFFSCFVLCKVDKHYKKKEKEELEGSVMV